MTTTPAPTTADDDFEWVHHHMNDLRPYEGMWIAVVSCRVVASGTCVSDILDEVEAQGLTQPFVTQIPTAIGGKMYFIG